VCDDVTFGNTASLSLPGKTIHKIRSSYWIVAYAELKRPIQVCELNNVDTSDVEGPMKANGSMAEPSEVEFGDNSCGRWKLT